MLRIGQDVEELLGEAQPNYKPPLVSCAVIDLLR